MATISLNDLAPRDEDVRLTIGHADFTLKGDQTYETDDQELVAACAQNPFLDVKVEPQAQDVQATNPNDPQVNSKADHLVAGADPAVVEAARKREAEIREARDPRSVIDEAIAATQPPSDVKATNSPRVASKPSGDSASTDTTTTTTTEVTS